MKPCPPTHPLPHVPQRLIQPPIQHFAQPVVLRLAAVAGLMGLLAACQPASPLHPDIRPVHTEQVGQHAEGSQTRYAGEIRARREVQLAFRVGGKVVERRVESGETVQAGQVLFRLDPQDVALQLAAAHSQLAAARMQTQETATALARSRKLLEQGFVSHAELERRQSQADAATAAQAAAEAGVRLLNRQQDYTALRADASGVLTALTAEVGQVVAAGSPVATLALEGEREVLIAVPESGLARLQAAQRLEVSLWAQPGPRRVGHLRELAARADPHTGTYAARIRLEESTDASARTALPRLGMTATVHVIDSASSSPAVGWVPISALRHHAGQDGVWVVNPSTQTVQHRAVQTGAVQGERIAIVQGLAEGETVVTAGVNRLHEGQQVRLAASLLARQ